MTNKIESPFTFGVRVEGDTFTDRQTETQRLKANFTYGINTILISPRRMGKTSLVDRVCSLIDNDDIRIARIDACEPLFIQQTEDLSAYQMNFLHALSNGVNTGFTQSAVLKKYQLGTAANITRLKKALTEKDLITTIAPKTIAMSDPILQMWLKRRVWRE